LGLTLPKRRKRKRRQSLGIVPVRAEHPNHVWTYDFIHDYCENGKKLKILTVADEFTREGLAVAVQNRMPSGKVLEQLGKLFLKHGIPKYLRSDNGPEFIAKRVKQWLKDFGVTSFYIDPPSALKYPGKLRLVNFLDEEEEDRIYYFLTNNFKLAASTIAAIYRARWKIEIFFKWIKQNLKIKNFLGTSQNAVLTQIWTAMIDYLLLAYLKYQTRYAYSMLVFTRMIQATLFERIQLIDLFSLKDFEGRKIKPYLAQTLLF